MTDISRTIEIIFGAVDQTGSGISSVADNLNRLTDATGNITEPLSEIADYAVKAEAAIVSLAGVYGGYAMVKASEFEQAQIDLAKVLTDIDPRIEEFTDSVMELSEQYGVSSAEILQGIANFKQAGFTAEEAALLQKNALDLMIAGDVEAANASEILISAIKGFGSEASSASRYIEALNNVSNDYAADVAQLGEGMSRISPVLKTMGFSFEEGTGLLTPMIEVFRDGGVAAEALKTGLLKLVDDAKPVKDALAALGVSQLDLNGNMRSGRDIFYDVATAFQKVDENQKLVFAGQLFGIEQAPKLVTVFDNLNKVNEITASAMAVTGSAAKEVDLRLASTAKQADIAVSSFENLAIAIGKELNGMFTGVVSGSSSVLQALRAIVESGGLEPFLLAMRPYVEEFAKTLDNMAKNLPEAFKGVDFSGLIAALKDLGFEFGSFFDGLDLNTVEGLQDAIQFLVDSFTSLSNVVSGIVDAWGPVVRGFIEGGDAFNQLDARTQKAIGTMLGAAQVFERLKGAVLDGSEALKTIGDALTTIATVDVGARLASMLAALSGGGLAAGAAAFGAVTVAAYGMYAGIDANITAWKDYKNTQDIITDSATGLAEKLPVIKDKLEEISKRTGVTVTSMEELNKAVDDGRLVFDEASGAYALAGEKVRDFDAEVAAAAGSSFDFADEVNKMAKVLNVAEVSAEEAKKGFETLAQAEKYLADTAREGHAQFIEFRDGLYHVTEGGFKTAEAQKELAEKTKEAAEAGREGSEEWKRVQEVLLKTQEQANNFTVEMEKLSNDRYEIEVQAAVDLKTAEIEAQTQRIASAFTAVSDVIGSLTGGVTELWSLFSDKAGFVGESELEAAAMRMEERLDAELDLKRQMTEAAMAQTHALTDRLNSGQPLISIDGGTLAPELELVFEKILKFTQVRMSQEGLAMLVGL